MKRASDSQVEATILMNLTKHLTAEAALAAGGAEAETEVGVAAAVQASVVKSRRARGFPQMRAESAQ